MKNFTSLLIMLCLPALTTHAQINLDSALIACYPFSGNANDMSGNNHNGTVFGPVLTADRFGNQAAAYEFDGSNDYINIGQFAGFTASNEMTIGVWIQPNQVITQTILMLQPDDFNDRLNAMAYYNHNGAPAHVWDFGNCAAGGRLFEQGVVFSNAWQHFVYTVKPNDGMKIYKNGVLEYSITTSSQVIDRQRDLYIGGGVDNATAQFYFDGIIDDMRIYDRALTAAEVQALYGTTLVCSPTSLSDNPNGTENYSVFLSNDLLKITLEPNSHDADFKLLSADGKEVITRKNLHGGDSVEFSVSGLPSGVYVYTFSAGKVLSSGKVMRIQK